MADPSQFAYHPPAADNMPSMAERLRQGNIDLDRGAIEGGMLKADPGQERLIRSLKGEKRPIAPDDGGV